MPVKIPTLMNPSPDTFRFADYLKRLPAKLVFERFFGHSSLKRKIISASMVQDITSRFSSEKNLADAFSGLSKETRFKVSLSYLLNGWGFLPDPMPTGQAAEETFHKKADNNGEALKGFDDELIDSFLVYAVKDTCGRIRYLGFDEFEPKLRSLCARTVVEKTRTSAPKETQHSHPFLCVNDIAIIVSLASQHRLMKTKAGSFSKQSEHTLRMLLQGAQSSFDGDARFPWSPEVIAIAYAFKKGLIFIHGEQFVAEHGKIGKWLSAGPDRLYEDIVDFAFSYVPLWRKSILFEMLAKPGAPWLSTEAFLNSPDNEINTTIQLLAYFGIVDYNKSRGHGIFTRSRLGASKTASDEAVTVLPDFSAVLPQETAPENLYWFSRIARLESFDKVYKGTICKEVLFDSLSVGIDPDSILTLLMRWRASGNVVETVREWIREFSRVAMEECAIVISSNEKVTRQLTLFEPLKKCLQPIQAHSIFRIVGGQEAAVAGMLSEMGFDARSPMAQSPMTADPRQGGVPLPFPVDMQDTRPSPILDFGETLPPVPDNTVTQGKYGPHLKSLELADLMHVIDYALLMDNRLRIEYSGSSDPFLRKGVYVVRPIGCKKGNVPVLEAETQRSRGKKVFLLSKIQKIGVEPHDGENM